MPNQLSKGDWEDFVAMGRVPGQIRDNVLQSWRRSSNYRISGLKRAPLLSDEQLLTQRALARRLRLGAQKALLEAGRLLDDTGNILLLCDATGVVIDAAGDRRVLDRGRENHLHLGGTWTEEAIGTNAIGTALHLGQAVTVRQYEHFCEEIQRWNCSATPIRDPGSGRILGVLDISWPGGVPQLNAAALSATLARQVEADLTRSLSRERETLMERGHLAHMRRGNEPMLVIDRSGADVFATEDFAHFCADDDALSDLRQRVPALIDQTPETIAEALSDCMPGTDLEVLGQQDDAIGVMITLRRRTHGRPDPGAELGRIGRAGQTIARLCGKAQRLARTDLPVLIEGETGVGKTFMARALHRASAQAEAPFELIDCSELTEGGLRDALTRGYYLTKGTLCLNSPGAAAPDVQKLLLGLVERALDGGSRVIALSTRHLYDEMMAGRFRGDLYYRIAGARLEIPPLRQRRDEIAPLLGQLVQRHAADTGGRELRFTSRAMDRLRGYGWPGNLREMQNLIASLDALSATGLIDEPSLPPEYREKERASRDDTLRDVERQKILDAVEAEGGNLSRAARRLGIARSTLYLKLDSYGIDRASTR